VGALVPGRAGRSAGGVERIHMTDYAKGLLRAAEICKKISDDDFVHTGFNLYQQGAFDCLEAIRAEASQPECVVGVDLGGKDFTAQIDCVVVPVEPTKEMIEAANGHLTTVAIYQAMLRAAGEQK